MFRFRWGKFTGRTLEHVMLREASVWAWLENWAENKPNLEPMLREFRGRRRKLSRAPIHAKCSEETRKRTAKWLTLPIDQSGNYWASPYFWCDKHDP